MHEWIFGSRKLIFLGKQFILCWVQWTDEENAQLPSIIEKATTAIQMYLTVGIEKTMTFVNQQ